MAVTEGGLGGRNVGVVVIAEMVVVVDYGASGGGEIAMGIGDEMR